LLYVRGVYRDSVDVKIARQVAKVCRQPHQVISVGQDYLREFRIGRPDRLHLGRRHGRQRLDGSLRQQDRPRDRALRLTGNYGQEILRSAVAFKAGPWPSQVLDEEFARLIGEARQTYGPSAAAIPWRSWPSNRCPGTIIRA